VLILNISKNSVFVEVGVVLIVSLVLKINA